MNSKVYQSADRGCALYARIADDNQTLPTTKIMLLKQSLGTNSYATIDQPDVVMGAGSVYGDN
ncbi:MAG: hypothetical protein MJK13_03365 [Pseudomonadales bacterium]|nr:hypothetical protein [Pseudomonadales bacterium]